MAEPVVNASPLIHLGNAGHLSLLHDLFGIVLVPQTVGDEILVKGELASRELSQSPWIRFINPDEAPPSLAAWNLRIGETSVLAHALANPGTEAILDDWAARRCAKSFGIPVCGTLGVILRATRKGLLYDPITTLHAVKGAGMWLSPTVFEEVLRLAREMKKQG